MFYDRNKLQGTAIATYIHQMSRTMVIYAHAQVDKTLLFLWFRSLSLFSTIFNHLSSNSIEIFFFAKNIPANVCTVAFNII